jgi:hypothetical protein
MAEGRPECRTIDITAAFVIHKEQNILCMTLAAPEYCRAIRKYGVTIFRPA